MLKINNEKVRHIVIARREEYSSLARETRKIQDTVEFPGGMKGG